MSAHTLEESRSPTDTRVHTAPCPCITQTPSGLLKAKPVIH